MFEVEGTAPDVLDADDPAVRRLPTPERVWVDVAALWGPAANRATENGDRPGGVAVTGLARGVLWARVMTYRGWWLGVVSMELARGGSPVLTTAALVPSWALRRRVPTRDRGLHGKAANRPTLAQRAAQGPATGSGDGRSGSSSGGAAASTRRSAERPDAPSQRA